MFAADHSKVKFSRPGANKRGAPGVIEGQKEKRQRMDRSVTQQCSGILKKLMAHPAGWVFNQPVDPVALNIPDYFSIISEPMDLGTIKSKLEKNLYFGAEEFADDVRLTFSNAMIYNPPSNNVHLMAKELNNIFNTRWESAGEKWNCESTKVEQGRIPCGRTKKAFSARQNCHKTLPLHTSLVNKRSMSSVEKQQLRKEVVDVLKGKMPPHVRDFFQRNGLICRNEEKMVMDIDAFDDGFLWELKRIIKSSFDTRVAEVELAKPAQNHGGKSLGKNLPKGTDGGNRHARGSVNTKLPLSSAPCKCESCGNITCQCSLHNDSTYASSSGLSAKSTSTSQMSKSDPDSDGAVSAVDDENICPSSHLTTPATAAAPGEGWETPLFDVQMSPKRALRAALLKSRFADTILKAQQKTLLDHVMPFFTL
ncbi:hypothetical protein L1049_009613 [Liquidambar formosana]|uniref:Bromo domain-containing protein n=1 Tax=Liquidambar formosana TaxID=63359 RepID=A0AAP0R462_LIQFO